MTLILLLLFLLLLSITFTNSKFGGAMSRGVNDQMNSSSTSTINISPRVGNPGYPLLGYFW